jgi:hypothetical protein
VSPSFASQPRWVRSRRSRWRWSSGYALVPCSRYRVQDGFFRNMMRHGTILMDRKVSRSHAQTNSRGGQRGVLPLSSGRGCWPDPVGMDALAGARARAVLGAHAGARRGSARRGSDRAGWGVRAFRRGRLRDTGTGRRARASGRRRGVSICPQPHVRGGAGGHRRSGAHLGPARTATVRLCRLAGRCGVCPLLRGTHPHPTLWRGLRGLPACGACLVASPVRSGGRASWNGWVPTTPGA